MTLPPTRRPRPSAHARTPALSIRLLELTPSRLLVAVAAIAVACELAWLLFDFELAAGPTMPVLASAAVAPAVAIAWWRQVPAGARRVWLPTWTVLAAAAAVVLPRALVDLGPAAAIELIAATAGEEVTYRLAIPITIVAVARHWWPDRPQQTATLAAVGAIVWFVLLPGHLVQIAAGGPPVAAGFVATAIVFHLAVWAGGALGPALALHILINVTTATLPAAGNLVLPVGAAAIFIGIAGAQQAGLPAAARRSHTSAVATAAAGAAEGDVR